HAALARLNQQWGRRDEALREAGSAREIIESLAAALPDPSLRETFLRNAMLQLALATFSIPARQEFAGLSPREREVAVLIAQGKSNRAIAEELVLSERTIEKHVENIMSKLGLNARTQIAVWAVENGLKS